MKKKILVDIGGADSAPEAIIKGAISSLYSTDEFDIVIAGPESVIRSALENESETIRSRIEMICTDAAVSNYDDPRDMIRGLEDTSMVQGLIALKARDDICGMVSAGSTGCLMVGSIFRLGLFKGLMQPALSSALLNIRGEYFCLVDCGANVNCKVKDMVDHARMGSAFMEAINGTASPKVGLVNVGREKGKGNDLAKAAYEALEAEESINFIGNIEGSDVLTGEADVVVCDGFTGNILLKNLEAAGMTAAGMMGNPEQVVRFFDYNSQGGATFLGTRKIIVKAHGAATGDTFRSCIEQVWRLEKGGFTERMAARMK